MYDPKHTFCVHNLSKVFLPYKVSDDDKWRNNKLYPNKQNFNIGFTICLKIRKIHFITKGYHSIVICLLNAIELMIFPKT